MYLWRVFTSTSTYDVWPRLIIHTSWVHISKIGLLCGHLHALIFGYHYQQALQPCSVHLACGVGGQKWHPIVRKIGSKG
jgi:hypothetical protein